jgi:hypothetical protein
MTVVLVVGLSLFLVLQVFFGENIVFFLISHTFQRLFEFGYCLVVIITHWRTFQKVPRKKDNDQIEKRNAVFEKLLS